MGYAQIAAVDLGSNSFRLEVGRVVDDQIYPLDTVKEPVRLASGLDAAKNLDAAAQQRAVRALALFGERLRGFQPGSVRAVATNTLRVAKNARELLPAFETALGFPIEVIGGREEARLIYIGAVHELPATRNKRLVVDIGGGSTEFIVGKKLDPLLMESLYMGCVSYSLRFFPEGRVDRKRFQDAQLAAAREIATIAHDYRALGWEEGAATSGTARAIVDLLEANGLNPDGASGITRSGLGLLREALIRAGAASQLKLEGMRADRIPVFAGGLAIMCAIFEAFGLERLVYSEGALRLGVLYDQLGRFQQHDMRDVTVRQFMRRYQVDVRQAERVERDALTLLSQMVPFGDDAFEADLRQLRWASLMHEIGLSIAHSGFHKHGAYIVGNADMPGFSRRDQERLAQLILSQRGKLEKLQNVPFADPLWRLVCALRLGVLFNRSRDDSPLPACVLRQTMNGFTLDVPGEWLSANPLSAAALGDEALVWQRLGIGLRIRRRSGAKRPPETDAS